MSNIIGNLLNNASALNVHSAGVETAGRNLANVNNPEYARQRVTLRDNGNYQAGNQTHSFGIAALGVEHVRNQILDGQIMTENMNRASLETQAELMREIEAALGETLDSSGRIDTLESGSTVSTEPAGLGKAIDDFFNAWTELSSSTENESLKEVVLHRAEQLIDQFRIADERIEELDSLMEESIEDEVAEANDLLTQIADLNARIARFEIQKGTQAPELRDERQGALEDLGSIIDFELRENGENPLMVDLVSFTADGAPLSLLTGASVPGQLRYTPGGIGTEDIISFAPGGANAGETLSIKGGSLEGYLQVKDTELTALAFDFDNLAQQLVTQVNTAYQGTPADGINFFVATGTTAETIDFDDSLFSSFTVDGQTITDLDGALLKTTLNTGGGNDIAKAIGDLATTDTMGNGTQTFSEYIATTATRVGATLNNAETAIEGQTIIDNYLQAQRESYSGVSLDEEMTDLMRFQRAFQGTSRVISVLDEMLSTVVNELKR